MRLKKLVTGVAIAGALVMPASALAYGGGGGHHQSRSGGSLINVSNLVNVGNVQTCGILTILSKTTCVQYN